MNWESIGINEYRAKVPGGWLVKVYENVTSSLMNWFKQDGWWWINIPDSTGPYKICRVGERTNGY